MYFVAQNDADVKVRSLNVSRCIWTQRIRQIYDLTPQHKRTTNRLFWWNFIGALKEKRDRVDSQTEAAREASSPTYRAKWDITLKCHSMMADFFFSFPITEWSNYIGAPIRGSGGTAERWQIAICLTETSQQHLYLCSHFPRHKNTLSLH